MCPLRLFGESDGALHTPSDFAIRTQLSVNSLNHRLHDTQQTHSFLLTPTTLISLTTPLVPLSPQFPLDLTLANQQMQELEEAQQPQRNIEVFAEHQFPWWGIGIAIIGLLGWLSWNKWHQKAMKTRLKTSIPSPSEKSLIALQQLQIKPWLQEGQYREYYLYLIEIARQYMQEEWQLPSLSQTKEEIFHSLKQRSDEFSEDQRRMIFGLFNQADRIKFASYQPSLAECQQAYYQVREMIESKRMATKID